MPPHVFTERSDDVVYAIDPATKVLGWAKFVMPHNNTAYLADSGYIRQRSDKEESPQAWIGRLDKMVDQVRELILMDLIFKNGGSVVVLIELPDTYSGGRGEAASASGAIMKLSSFVFALRQEMCHIKGVGVILYPVRKWKGTTKKEATQLRARKHWGWSGSDHNEADAVGIGDYHIRKVLRRTPYVRPKTPTRR